MTQYKNEKSKIALPFIISISLASGILLGANMLSPTGSSGQDISKSVLKFREILTHINAKYVDTVDTEELVEAAIDEMLTKLDPHTNYITGEELEISRSNLSGGFEGIGIEFGIIKDTLRVILPIKDGPSEEAGLVTGDKIIAIDGEGIAGVGLTSQKVFDKLRGKKGSKVTLKISRPLRKKPFDVEITRDKIPQNSIDIAYMVDETTGYLKVSRFSASTFTDFQTALTSLTDQGAKKLILDLTDNPGGYLDRAVDMIDEFIAGDSMIVYTEGKKRSYNKKHKAHRKGIFEDQPLIVMINEGSASASEIVSGALQDNDRALIVGRRSFGKGLVQMPIDLSDGSELRLTISRYYTPSGRSIQKPYEAGDRKSYGKDIAERYGSGELFYEDSIKYDHLQEFKTANGRTVYGGGGITPDYFVPIDTNALLTKFYNSGTIREFVIEYYAANKKQLNKLSIEDYMETFLINETMILDFKTLAEDNELDFSVQEFIALEEDLKTHLKARLARLIFGNEGFYPLYNESNDIFQAALALFEEAANLTAVRKE